jgi:hypothetical protein
MHHPAFDSADAGNDATRGGQNADLHFHGFEDYDIRACLDAVTGSGAKFVFVRRRQRNNLTKSTALPGSKIQESGICARAILGARFIGTPW